MHLNVAESKAYEGRHRLPPYDTYLTTEVHAALLDLGVDFTEGGKPGKPGRGRCLLYMIWTIQKGYHSNEIKF